MIRVQAVKLTTAHVRPLASPHPTRCFCALHHPLSPRAPVLHVTVAAHYFCAIRYHFLAHCLYAMHYHILAHCLYAMHYHFLAHCLYAMHYHILAHCLYAMHYPILAHCLYAMHHHILGHYLYAMHFHILAHCLCAHSTSPYMRHSAFVYLLSLLFTFAPQTHVLLE